MGWGGRSRLLSMAQQARSTLGWTAAAALVLVAVFLYLHLITSNCPTDSLAGTLESIRAFHTSDGC